MSSLVGTTLGKYVLQRPLGSGGMGEVFLGVQPAIGAMVAIKVLNVRFAEDPGVVERFFNEARAVNQIRHESIINVLDLDMLPDGRPFIVMEYVDGRPLSHLIQQHSPLGLGGVARVLGEALDALQAAHRRAIIHRDLKPDNLMVTRGGRVKVLDFGIAKLGGEVTAPALTRSGELLGTPHYMAPEQIAAAAVDGRTDVYAAGVILFEATTGQKPFNAESLYDLFKQHMELPPPSPRALRPDLPPAYEAVILQALQKDASRRYGGAAEMAAALRAAAEGSPPALLSDDLPEVGATVATGAHTPVAVAARLASGRAQAPTLQDTPRPPGPAVTPTRGLSAPATPTPAAAGVPTPRSTPTERVRSRLPVVVFGVVLLAVVAGSVGLFLALRGRGARQAAAVPDGGHAIVAARGVGTGSGSSPPPAGVPDARAVTAVAPARATPTRAPGRPAAPTPAPRPQPQPQPKVAAAAAPDAATKSPQEKLGLGVKVIETKERQILLPGPATPKRFDALGYLPQARQLARKLMSDAELIDFDVQGVYPDGHVDLSLPDFEANYWFRSRQASKLDPRIPANVEQEIRCLVYVVVSAKETRVFTTLSRKSCKEPFRKPWRCSLAGAWKLAMAQGLRGGNVVAKVSWLWDGWYFDLGDKTESVKDACP